MRFKNLKYASVGCLGKPLDDPAVSLEGIEFVEYPKECARLKKLFAEIKRLYPGTRTMFHIAHGLYTTSKPHELFGDSLVIKADGTPVDYGNQRVAYYRKYFSEERVKEGYRWYIFYPTMDNAFGKAMLAATDYMIEHMNVDSMFGDGFISGYAQVAGNKGGYTHDRWDGHSVIIDSKTKTVKKKVGNVTLLALPVLKAVTRKLEAAGGVLVTNGAPGPRSFWKENVINTGESGGGEGSMGGLHIGGRTVTCLGRHGGFIKIERDVYEDILLKLDWGGLYFFYGDGGKLQHDSIIRQMYPITVTSIHAGTVRGEDRIITRHSGVYGWRDDRSLHVVHRYDSRGWPVSHDFPTAVDRASVRTELKLEHKESAVVKKTPMEIQTRERVNLIVAQYDTEAIRILLNGRGRATVKVRSGDFDVKPGAAYRVRTHETRNVRATQDGVLSIPLNLTGPVTLRIEAN